MATIVLPLPPDRSPFVRAVLRSDPATQAGQGLASRVDADVFTLYGVSIALPDGDYYLLIENPSAVFVCRVKDGQAIIADFWPQLDAMQAGQAYQWTNQAGEVMRVNVGPG